MGPTKTRVVARASDVLARLGGDEFALFIPNLSSEKDSCEMTARLRKAVATINSPHPDVHISASIGFAVFPDEVRSSSELLRLADERMYQDKRSAETPSGQSRSQRGGHQRQRCAAAVPSQYPMLPAGSV
ncbi:GGDEF domain-containing protein [Rubellimicrobium rubrum]|uniref:GGDEF domain-containing protein n=1 Tax=Rubellimicrobium rubrum TaxID=2585369 RepID=A0A5C4MYF1_9RHOB|nr:GGDEF domain-containing protein [Rubellimicrobium rubrum]